MFCRESVECESLCNRGKERCRRDLAPRPVAGDTGWQRNSGTGWGSHLEDVEGQGDGTPHGARRDVDGRGLHRED